MEQEKRQVHNTNSPNFVKLDYTDITNIIAILMNDVGEASLEEDEIVTLERLRIIQKFMKKKYNSREN